MILLLLLLGLGFTPAFQDEDDEFSVEELTDLSLEELLDIEVVTVSRKPQTVSRSPAAVYVITQEDIRRSGHSSIPEILRMAPGVHVARINSNSWAVAARGFNGRFNNKMLVMIDGRTIFSTLFSGVFWDVQDLHLGDIERIEVIRGPGGTMWGANAVNGIINIITRKAADTQDFQVHGRVGDEDEGIFSWRLGGALGELDGHWRVFGKAVNRDNSRALGGGEHPDDWKMLRSGFRMDWAEDRDSFTIQGGAYSGRVQEIDTVTRMNPPPDRVVLSDFFVDGANLLGRWTRNHGEASESEFQIYYDVTQRDGELFKDNRNTLDLDYQHRYLVRDDHELLYGFGYRWVASNFRGSTGFTLDQGSRNDHLLSAFVQDEYSAIYQELSIVTGIKIEHNDYTGLELEPSIRAVWTPDAEHSVWGSISRAVRTPSQAQHDLIQDVAETVGPSTNVVTRLLGSSGLGSDELMAYEIGWRYKATENAAFDITAFYNDFDAADNFAVGTTIDLGGGNFVVPVFFDNNRQAEVYGLELALDLEISEDWKIRSALSYLDLQFEGDVVSTPIQPRSDDEEPNWLGNVRSQWAVSDDFDIDVGLYYADDLDDLNVPGYLRFDTRFSYRPSKNWEIAFGVQNITDSAHAEFNSASLSTSAEIERSIYFDVNYRK